MKVIGVEKEIELHDLFKSLSQSLETLEAKTTRDIVGLKKPKEKEVKTKLIKEHCEKAQKLIIECTALIRKMTEDIFDITDLCYELQNLDQFVSYGTTCR